MLHYDHQHVSSSTLLILRRTNFITTASGIVTLCKQPYSMQVERGLCSALHNLIYLVSMHGINSIKTADVFVFNLTVCLMLFWPCIILQNFSNYQLNAKFLYSSTICMLHYDPQHVSSTTLLILRRTNCITTASGIVTLEIGERSYINP